MTVKHTYEALIVYVHSLQAICILPAGLSRLHVDLMIFLYSLCTLCMYVMRTFDTFLVECVRICSVPNLSCTQTVLRVHVFVYVLILRASCSCVRTASTYYVYARFVSSSLSALC